MYVEVFVYVRECVCVNPRVRVCTFHTENFYPSSAVPLNLFMCYCHCFHFLLCGDWIRQFYRSHSDFIKDSGETNSTQSILKYFVFFAGVIIIVHLSCIYYV